MRAIWLLAIVMAMFGAWYAVSISDFTSTNGIALVLSLMFLALVSLAPGVYYLSHKSANVVSPISLFGLSFFFYGVLGSLGIIWDPGALLAGEQGLNFLPFATFLLTVGFLFFCLGYLFLPLAGPQTRGPFQWKKNRIRLAVLILAAAAWGVRYYAMTKGLISPKLISDPAITILGVNPFILSLLLKSDVLSRTAIAICLIAYFRLYADQPANKRRRWLLVALFFSTVEAAYFMVVGLTRMPVLGVALSLFCVTSLVKKPPVKQALLFIALFILLIVPIVNNTKNLILPLGLAETSRDIGQVGVLFRQVFPEAFKRLVTDYAGSHTAQLGHPSRLSSADFVIFLAERQEIEARPPMGPWPLIDNLSGLVPRVLWRDKPVSFVATSDIQSYYGLLFWPSQYVPDVVASPVAEFYAYFGILGIVLGMLALGVLMRIVYRTLVERSLGRWNTGLVLYAVLAFELTFQETTIAGAMAALRDMPILWVFLAVVLEGRIPLLERRRVDSRWTLASNDNARCNR